MNTHLENLEKLEKMRGKTNQSIEEAKCYLQDYNATIDNHLEQVENEYHRVAELSGQAGYICNRIDQEFKEKTKLDFKDTVILFLAVGLQCARQYFFTNENFRITANQGDELMENILSPLPPTWQEVLTQSVPYDAITRGSELEESTGLSGATHRYRTLGHDPLLGWIFGTANIMTNALTKYNFETYYVKNMMIVSHFPQGVCGMMEKAGEWGSRDPMLLGASVARQAVHFGSDYFTKQGLPVPLISTVNNDLAQQMLTKWHIDMWSITRGAALSAFINQLIAVIHQLFYEPGKDGTESMYEVRTRKILSYSNVIASSSNVVVTAFTQDVAKLDVGGLLVTLYRVVDDYKFINKIKKDFLKNELYNQIVGTEYDFMED
jgi:hypothetical protein